MVSIGRMMNNNLLQVVTIINYQYGQFIITLNQWENSIAILQLLKLLAGLLTNMVFLLVEVVQLIDVLDSGTHKHYKRLTLLRLVLKYVTYYSVKTQMN